MTYQEFVARIDAMLERLPRPISPPSPEAQLRALGLTREQFDQIIRDAAR